MEPTNKTRLRKLVSLLIVMLLTPAIMSVTGETPGFQISSNGAIGPVASEGIAEVTINGTSFMVNGESYTFRGVNVQFKGLHHLESGCQSISRTTFELYKGWNVNLFRVWLNMEMASPRYEVWDQDFFDDLELVLHLAEEYGIYLLISGLHSYNLSPEFSGTGFPSWMFAQASSQNFAWDMMYRSVVNEDAAYPEIRNAIREYYHRICNICKDRNIVMGYDIFNEPKYRSLPGYSKINSSYFYEKLSVYITETDQNKPQCVENNFIDNNYKPQIPNLFVSPHGYAAHTHVYSPSQMKSYFTSSDYWVQGPNWNVPTMNAEWFLGTQSEAEMYGLSPSDIARWYDIYIKAMEELGITWAVLRCEASPSSLHWAGSPVREVLHSYWELNIPPPSNG
jgi:hypothetical protein